MRPPPKISQHDPDCCGLDPSLDCAACLAYRQRLELLRNPVAAAEAKFESLCRQCPPLRPEVPVAPLGPEVVRAFVKVLLAPEYKATLQEVLMELLCEPIGELLAECRQEVLA